MEGKMRATLNPISTPFLILLVWLAMVDVAIPQERSPRQIVGDGKGTIHVGRERFDLHSVIVKLLEDGKAEIILVSDITFFLKGTWARNEKVPQEIDLNITGSVTSGGVQGNGKLILRGAESMDRLTLEGSSSTSSRKVKVSFVAR